MTSVECTVVAVSLLALNKEINNKFCCASKLCASLSLLNLYNFNHLIKIEFHKKKKINKKVKEKTKRDLKE